MLFTVVYTINKKRCKQVDHIAGLHVATHYLPTNTRSVRSSDMESGDPHRGSFILSIYNTYGNNR